MPTVIAKQKFKGKNGVLEIPVYSLSDFPNSPLRVKTATGIGVYDLVAPSTETPIRVMTKLGIKGINLTVGTGGGGGTPDPGAISFTDYSLYGPGTAVESDTSDYIQIYTNNNGNGISFPITGPLVVGNVLTCSIDVDIIQGVDDVISVRVWNVTQNKWVTTNMKTGTQTSGLHNLSNSLTLSSSFASGDALELRVVQSWKNSTHDDPFRYKLMKTSRLTVT